ncbi:MAG: hypothetical protein ACK47B_10830 [Armatimonadota bacterium]
MSCVCGHPYEEHWNEFGPCLDPDCECSGFERPGDTLGEDYEHLTEDED